MAETVIPILRCPACGYSAVDEARWCRNTDRPRTFEEQVDFFEVSGCDEGNVMCPECSHEFQINREPSNG